jgi:hypothetical protein
VPSGQPRSPSPNPPASPPPARPTPSASGSTGKLDGGHPHAGGSQPPEGPGDPGQLPRGRSQPHQGKEGQHHHPHDHGRAHAQELAGASLGGAHAELRAVGPGLHQGVEVPVVPSPETAVDPHRAPGTEGLREVRHEALPLHVRRRAWERDRVGHGHGKAQGPLHAAPALERAGRMRHHGGRDPHLGPDLLELRNGQALILVPLDRQHRPGVGGPGQDLPDLGIGVPSPLRDPHPADRV